jgi:hypothetical protein
MGRRSASSVHEAAAPGDAAAASLRRRLTFAAEANLIFDRLGNLEPFSRLAVVGGDWPLLRIPAHAARVGFDLFECLRTAGAVSQIGNVELALDGAARRVPQHPRYLTYWYDPSAHTAVGMHIGVDLIRCGGKYYVIENNIGPSVNIRRRRLYDAAYDPLVSGLAAEARAHGFKRVVPVSFRWAQFHLEEFERAGKDYGLDFAPRNCPLKQPGGARTIVALPRPLRPGTMYVIHSGLTSAVVSYVDNKWHAHRWLDYAVRNELPADTPVAVPPTSDELTLRWEDPGPRWPNLVVKLASSARSRHVVVARFEDEAEARRGLRMDGLIGVPRKLRPGFARSLLFGRDRVIYQCYVPPELDENQRAQMVRLHLLVSPLGATFLSAHLRVSRRSVPERAPRGVVPQDGAFIFNDADYRPVPPEMFEELRFVAAHLGQSIQRAVARKFETIAS